VIVASSTAVRTVPASPAVSRDARRVDATSKRGAASTVTLSASGAIGHALGQVRAEKK